MTAGTMRRFRPEDFLQSKSTLWIVIALTVVLFLVTNLPWHLDNYDQAKQAFTSFEMVEEDHWLYQRTPQGRVATKPPLVGWISAGFFAISRSWDVAWRLPSFLFACALSFILFRNAASAYGTIAGLLALSAFSLNLLTPRLATLVRTDMPLALIVFLIGLQVWQKIRKREGWQRRDRFVIFALLTAGMLIKGPIIYAFLLPAMAAFEWWRRKQDAPSSWFGWWPWFASLLIFLAWVIGGSIFVPQFYDHVVVREFLGRFGETVHRPQPLYFYIPHLLHKFAPWSVLIVFLSVLHVRLSKVGGIHASLRKISPDIFWLLCWALGGLLVMSLIPSKRVDRIFPIIPPLCLLVAAQVKGVLSVERLRGRALRWSTAVLVAAMLFASGYTVLKVVSGYRGQRDALVDFGRAVREQAAKGQWRYEVIKGNDEGLLLYLEKTRFVERERAVMEWNRGKLEALVVPTQDAANLVRELSDAALSGLESGQRGAGRGKRYVLITRSNLKK